MIMQNKALVTVFIPIYNVEKYINKCLTSLINQTYKNIEILAIDDGSPDNSKKIVSEFAKKDSRVKLIEKEMVGMAPQLKLE
ncbi:glycosyltransferase-like protein [Lactobacillus helveticus MTCC 5463]|nr:glycosyltransferase-like protein [Lactobacillus helveticus MTCC 5463]